MFVVIVIVEKSYCIIVHEMKSTKKLHNHGMNYFISDTDFLKILDVKWL